MFHGRISKFLLSRISVLRGVFVVILIIYLVSVWDGFRQTQLREKKNTYEINNLKPRKLRKKLPKELFLSFLRQNSTYWVTDNNGQGSI